MYALNWYGTQIQCIVLEKITTIKVYIAKHSLSVSRFSFGHAFGCMFCSILRANKKRS